MLVMGVFHEYALINRFANKKNIHLLWMSREASMVALFEKQVRIGYYCLYEYLVAF